MLAGAYALAQRFEEGLLELDRLCARLDAAEGAGDPALADVHSARGLLHLWTHDLDAAAADLELSLAAATRGGSFVARETARFYLAEVRYRQGRWDDAVLLAELSASVVDDSDQAWMAALPHATAAQPLAARGEPARRPHRAGDRSRGAGGRRRRDGAVPDRRPRGGGVRARPRRGDRAGRGARRRTGWAGHERIAPWRASYVEALVAEGRADEADEVAVWLAGQRSHRRWCTTTWLGPRSSCGPPGGTTQPSMPRRRSAWRSTPTASGPTRAPASSWPWAGRGATAASVAGPSASSRSARAVPSARRRGPGWSRSSRRSRPRACDRRAARPASAGISRRRSRPSRSSSRGASRTARLPPSWS